MPTFKRVQPGDPLRIPADDYNAAMDAAREALARRTGTGLLSATPQNTVALVRNNTGADVGRCSVLGLGAPLITPTLNLQEFQTKLSFQGVTPTLASHAGGRIAVTLNPIRSGEIGKAMLVGATACKIKTPGDPADVSAADVDDGNATRLITTLGGVVRVLWIQSVSDAGGSGHDRWGIVVLGGGIASGTIARFRVKSIHDNYLVCRSWDGTTEGTIDVLIAKPFELQPSVLAAGWTWWNYTTNAAMTMSASSTGGSGTHDPYLTVSSSGFTAEKWIVTPQYFVNAQIYAVFNPVGGTGVVVSGQTALWMDTNIAGRAWGAVAP